MHGLDHVYFYDNLAGATHAGNYAISREADSQVHVVAAHAVKASLHDLGKWLVVGAVDDLVVQEGIRNLLQQFFVLYSLYGVALSSADEHHPLFLFELKALLFVVICDVSDFSLTYIHLLEAFDCE